MRFKHSVSLTADTFSSVFKLLLYRLATGVIFFSLTYVILKMGLSSVTESAELGELEELVGVFLRALVSGDVNALATFQETFQTAVVSFLRLLGEQIGSIAASVVGVCVMYLLSRFANGLAIFAVASTVNDRMGAYARTRFSAAYFRNIARAVKYELVYVPLAFVYDVLTVLACWFFFFFVPSLLPSWGFVSVLIAVSLTMTAIVCMQALKLSFISSWMPAMVDGTPLFRGFRESITEFKGFSHRFAGFLAAVYLVVFVNVGFAVCTFGSGLLLTVPLSFLFFLVMQFVNYYGSRGKKYFLTATEIVGGDR